MYGRKILCAGSLAHREADVDEIVRDHAEAYPTLHSVVAFVSTAVEAVAAFDHADTSFASGAPFLAIAEPALLLLALALAAPA